MLNVLDNTLDLVDNDNDSQNELMEELINTLKRPGAINKLNHNRKLVAYNILINHKKYGIRNNYANYLDYIYDGQWIKAKHLKFICDTVQKFLLDDLKLENGETAKILVLSVPPQHGKSMTVSEALPSWYLGKFPDDRVIIVGYNTEFASKFGRKNRSKIRQYGRKVFGIQMSKETSDEIEIKDKRGGFLCRGILSGITGNPAELIIIDDPIKTREEADSENHRNKIWEEYLNSVKTRLSANGKIILIQTRWHEDDLAGRIIKNEKSKTFVINLPCEAEEDDILDRKLGDPLFPEIGKDKKWLEDFKRVYQTKEGSRAWLSLFQGRPVSEKGNIIQKSWWKYYDTLPPIQLMGMSVDASFKDNEDSDFVSIQVWGKTGPNMYLIDLINERLNFPDTVIKIMQMKQRYPMVNMILIEDKANGSAIIQTLRMKISGIIPIEPKGGKVSRVNAISGYIESGNVLLPSFATWTSDFVDQFSKFPNGKNDDMVDACSQMLSRFAFYVTEDLPQLQKYNFNFEKPKEDIYYLGGEVDDSYINY